MPHRRNTPPTRNALRWLGLCAGALLAGGAHASARILELDCAGQPFVVEARPFAENAAGSSQVDVRYRYRGQPLAAIRYEIFYKNLDAYLQRDAARTRAFGLNLDTVGTSRLHGYDWGDTLYLPPDAFSASDFERLAACLEAERERIRRTFADVSITSRTFLGLMKTRTSMPVTGIARLVHAPAPIAGLYGVGNWYFVLVEAGGRVLVHSNFTANNPPVSTALGEVRRDGRRPTLLAPARYRFHGKEYETRDLLTLTDRHGRRMGDDYRLQVR